MLLTQDYVADKMKNKSWYSCQELVVIIFGKEYKSQTNEYRSIIQMLGRLYHQRTIEKNRCGSKVFYRIRG